jgi:aldose sugar dehydrogenase
MSDSSKTRLPTLDASRRASLLRLSALWVSASVPLVACGGADSPAPPPAPTPPAPPPAGPARATVLNSTLASPWGMAFLPDGRILVTQKGGSIVILSANGATKSNPLANVPAVVSSGQGGLLDVVIDPDFSTPGSEWVYFSYSEAGTGGSGTAVNRGRLDVANNRLIDVPATPIFRQLPKVGGSGHFGSRLVFRADKTLFVTLGERQLESPAQDLTGHLGKVVRINRDGSVPAGNPNLGAGARPEIWSYGHRNPQGAALHPGTGELWELEHGPFGGDELNIARAGNNHGWPLRSYGCSYADGGNNVPNCRIGGGTHAPSYVEPVSHWPGASAPVPSPSIAPSGLTFYTGSGFPEWQGNLFFGALAGTALWRVALNGNAEASRERLFASLGERIRCVRQGPDGWLYFLTDSGRLYRVDRA